MSGNGGNLSSLQAATAGNFRPDRGRKSDGNPMEDHMEEDFSDPGGDYADNDKSQESEDFSDGQFPSQEEWEEESSTSFQAGVKAVFPGGIANASRSSKKVSFDASRNETVIVTPTASSRRGGGGRGGQQGMASNGGGRGRSAARMPSVHTQYSAESVSDMETSISHQGVEASAKNTHGFRTARDLISDEGKVLKVVPDEPRLPSMKTYSYIMELQFVKPLSEKGILQERSTEFHVPTCLGSWIRKIREVAGEFMLQPYKAENSGSPITHEDQLPREDSESVGIYYHNHRIERNGVLKGMVKITTSVPWYVLKAQNSPFFKWLYGNKIYMRHTSFEADTVVLLGFFLGAHPDATRLNDFTMELKERLQLPAELDFQVVPRNLTIVESQHTKLTFGFKAVAVETDAKMAGEVREAMFRLGDPKVEKFNWPITGRSLFIPMARSDSWTTDSIVKMAKLHARNMSQLDQIFLDNLHNIDTPVTIHREATGTEATRTIRDLLQSVMTAENEDIIHSIHTTNREGVVRILVNMRSISQANNFLGTLPDFLRSALSPEDLDLITKGNRVAVTGRAYESSDSRRHASYAMAILRENPQDPDDSPPPSPVRKKSKMAMSYSEVAKRNNKRTHATDSETEVDSDLEEDEDDQWEQRIQSSFTKLFGDREPVKTDDIERLVQQVVDQQTKETEEKLDKKFASLTTDLQNYTKKENQKSRKLIQTMIDQQNSVLLSLAASLTEGLMKMHENINDVAVQTGASLTYAEIPKIEILKPTVVARRSTASSSSSSDEGT